MSGQQKSLFKRRPGLAPLPIAAVSAVVAGLSTLMIWQSPRFISAEVKPLILDFGSFGARPQRTWQSQDDEPSQQSDDAEPSASEESLDSDGSASAPNRSSSAPVRTQSSNGGLVLEWPRQRSQINSAAADAKSQAQRVLKEAEDYLKAGDLCRALNSARLAYSYPVDWQPGEQHPEELLAELESLAKDPTFVDSARRAAISEINSANGRSDSMRPSGIPDNAQERHSGIGVWKQAPESDRHDVLITATDSQSGVEDFPPFVSSADGNSDNVQDVFEETSTAEVSEPSSGGTPVSQPYESQPLNPTDSALEPGRLNIGSYQQVSESTADFTAQRSLDAIERLEPRPLIITDQRTAAAPANSPMGTLTFDVLATLTTIFAVLFFGTLFLFLAVLAMGRKLLGDNGVAFRIELVNSPLTVQAGAAAAAPAAEPASVINELKLDPDFEGILSMSEQRARQREAAIMEQFIENNVSLHKEVSENRAAA
jgi:hypothetical protein